MKLVDDHIVKTVRSKPLQVIAFPQRLDRRKDNVGRQILLDPRIVTETRVGPNSPKLFHGLSEDLFSMGNQ